MLAADTPQVIALAAVLSEPTDLLSMTLQHTDVASCSLEELTSDDRGVAHCQRHLYCVMHPSHPACSTRAAFPLRMLERYPAITTHRGVWCTVRVDHIHVTCGGTHEVLQLCSPQRCGGLYVHFN